MKILRIEELILTNFKKYNNFSIKFKEGMNEFTGSNRVGKTTIIDSYFWLLFGTNQNGESFDPIHSPSGIKTDSPCQVEGKFTLDGSNLQIKRIYQKKENKKGLNTFEYSFFINGQEKKKKEFDSFIKDNFGEEEFRIVCNINYFANLPIKRKREIVCSLFEQADDLTIIGGNPELIDLALLVGQGKDIGSQIDLSEGSLKECEEQLEIKRVKRAEIVTLRLEAQQNQEIFSQKKEELEKNISSIMGNLIEETKAFKEKAKREEEELISQKIENIDSNSSIKNSIKLSEYEIKSLTSDLEYWQKEKEKITKQYKQKKEAEPQKKDTCEYCGSTISKEKVEDFFSATYKEWKEGLNFFINKGKEINEKCDAIKQKLKDAIEKKNAEQAKIETIEKKQAESSIEEKILALKKEHKAKLDLLTDLLEERERVAAPLKKELQEIERKIIFCEETLSYEEKINELTKYIENLEEEIVQIKEMMPLFKLFSEKKVEFFQGQIKKLFSFIDFKMFDTLSNGSLRETCEPLYRGHSFKEMSGEERINSALDICLTLGRFYRIDAPIFIDNGESVVELIIPNGYNPQIIKMSVIGQKNKEAVKLT